MVHILLIVIYIAFISLGLPDCMLGAAWPSAYIEFGVPLSYAGGISLIIAFGTIVSSLCSDFLTKKLGVSKVAAGSVALTAIALFGFSISGQFWHLCLWAVPYGLGAGSIDAALNNYVAIHYTSKHMSWLHCMWGVGTIIGPYVMGYALSNGMTWNLGYRYISILQVGITVIMILSISLWKERPNYSAGNETQKEEHTGSVSLLNVWKIPGAIYMVTIFFCYCALEATAMLWGASYLNLNCEISVEKAAVYASFFCIGITVGRAVNGFLTSWFDDAGLIRLGEGVILLGVILILFERNVYMALAGLICVGVGCAPIYPSSIHATPIIFGPQRSQAIIGIEMACAYVGTMLMPAIFGVIAEHISIGLFPVYLLILLGIMSFMHLRLVKTTQTD